MLLTLVAKTHQRDVVAAGKVDAVAAPHARLRMAKAKPPQSATPRPGWNRGMSEGLLSNPRAPLLPSSLRLNEQKYYAACALIGLTSSQIEEPDKEWASEWALDMGEIMAKKAKKRWG
jgi:hypothetical protein